MSAQSCQAQARFLEEALALHATQVRDYVYTSLRRLSSHPEATRPQEVERFLAAADTLLFNLEQLLLHSRAIRTMNRLNREQMEAQIESLHTLLDETRQGALPVV